MSPRLQLVAVVAAVVAAVAVAVVAPPAAVVLLLVQPPAIQHTLIIVPMSPVNSKSYGARINASRSSSTASIPAISVRPAAAFRIRTVPHSIADSLVLRAMA